MLVSDTVDALLFWTPFYENYSVADYTIFGLIRFFLRSKQNQMTIDLLDFDRSKRTTQIKSSRLVAILELIASFL